MYIYNLFAALPCACFINSSDYGVEHQVAEWTFTPAEASRIWIVFRWWNNTLVTKDIDRSAMQLGELASFTLL